MSKEVLMKHHVVEIIDHLIKIVKLLKILPLNFECLPEALVLILLILDVSALLIKCVLILW